MDKKGNKVESKKESISSIEPEPKKTEFQAGMESIGMYCIDDNDNDKSNENSFHDGNILMINNPYSNNINK